MSLLLLTAFKTQAQTQTQMYKVQDTIAIDVLLLPDEHATFYAQSINEQLRKKNPQGYALDSTHRPHVTLLQRYVLAKDLPGIEQAIQQVLAGQDIRAVDLKATGYYPAPSGTMGLLLMEIDPTATLKSLQAKMITALQPYTVKGGTASAFIQDPGTPINQFTIELLCKALHNISYAYRFIM